MDKIEIKDNSDAWYGEAEIHIKLIPPKIQSGFCSCVAISDVETGKYKIVNACRLHQAWKDE